MVSRVLFLEAGQLRRIWPFFSLYLLLFAALTLADGLSLALFVQRVGASALPKYHGLSALCVMATILWYLQYADRACGSRLFIGIVAAPMLLFALIWAGMAADWLDIQHLGLLFVGREVALAMVLLHFGAYLQDFFTRQELNRVMPVIYAGGRVGGILGGALLEHLSRAIPPENLLLLLVALLAACLLGIQFVRRHVVPVAEPDAPALAETATVNDPLPALDSFAGFLRLVWSLPLLFWITVSTVVYFVCRVSLNVQYNTFFAQSFASEVELAQFLGRYTQIALCVSLVLQLLVIGRLVAWIGLRGAQFVYALMVLVAALFSWGEMTLLIAVFARFVEGELRFGLRNPVAQMIVNQFPKSFRTRTRAWSLGLLIPLSTLVASGGLALLMHWQLPHYIPHLTALAGIGYLLASVGLARSIVERPTWLSRCLTFDSHRPLGEQLTGPHTASRPVAVR